MNRLRILMISKNPEIIQNEPCTDLCNGSCNESCNKSYNESCNDDFISRSVCEQFSNNTVRNDENIIQEDACHLNYTGVQGLSYFAGFIAKNSIRSFPS